jgi:hypothetical protein
MTNFRLNLLHVLGCTAVVSFLVATTAANWTIHRYDNETPLEDVHSR